MRIAVLDIGSNSAQLQVIDGHAGGPPLPVHTTKFQTCLAPEMGADGAISDAGITRVIDAVARSAHEARRLGIDQLYPFVTAAVRDACNRDAVLTRVESETGIAPQFLSGAEEARLTYLAVRHWFGWRSGTLLNIDIGGGSMEIVLGRDLKPDVAVSLPLGARRVSVDFLPTDPPTAPEIKQLRRYARQQIRYIADRVHWDGPPRGCVVTSKTFKQLARMAGAPPRRKGPFVARTLSRAQVKSLIMLLAAVPAADRASFQGVKPSRADQILGGAIVAYETMRCLGVTEAAVSPWALREGVALAHLASLGEASEPLAMQPLGRDALASRSATVTALRHDAR